MSFEDTGSRLLALLNSAEPPECAELLRLLDTWSEEFERCEQLDAEDGCNHMHLVGASLCVLLHRCEQQEFDLRAALGHAAGRVLLSEKPLRAYGIDDLLSLVTALQVQFASLYALESGGYGAEIDVELVCVQLLRHFGSLLAEKEQLQAPGSRDPPIAAVHGLLDVDADGFCSVRAETIVQLLNGLHSMYCLHSLLTRASVAPPAECEELHAHHREASNETFFTYSMISDCVVGSIAQYAHRFAHLFHSVSQVVYYNFPSYNRQTQLPLEQLRRTDAPAVNVLPLLTELHPEIPVLFEHTGDGCRAQHAKQPCSWVLWSSFVLLVDCNMQAYVAADIRSLLSVANAKRMS